MTQGATIRAPRCSRPDPDGFDAPSVPTFFPMGGTASVSGVSPFTISLPLVNCYSIQGGVSPAKLHPHPTFFGNSTVLQRRFHSVVDGRLDNVAQFIRYIRLGHSRPPLWRQHQGLY